MYLLTYLLTYLFKVSVERRQGEGSCNVIEQLIGIPDIDRPNSVFENISGSNSSTQRLHKIVAVVVIPR